MNQGDLKVLNLKLLRDIEKKLSILKQFFDFCLKKCNVYSD